MPPRKPNYNFEKRRKEQERAAKQEAKRADRKLRRDEGRGPDGELDEFASGAPAEDSGSDVAGDAAADGTTQGERDG